MKTGWIVLFREGISRPKSVVAAFARTRVLSASDRTLARAATVLKPLLLIACFFVSFPTGGAEPQAGDNAAGFRIRGTLPWHNFLSGPTAWDEEDYEKYLDRLQSLGLNYITFHCYTGGAERYATYVEPLICVRYRDVVPRATFDTSLTPRWGYRPLTVDQFAFGTGKLFQPPPGKNAFGPRCALLASDNRDHYTRAQGLMRRVIQLAHERGIQVGIGFEFGIHPPELASIVPPRSWIRGAMLPDPTHPASIEILHNTLDDMLRAYPELDWIWLWLHEHTMFVGQAASSGAFQELMKRDGKFFGDEADESGIFTGVWSLAYIRAAHKYLSRRAPDVRMAISGWGGGSQLPGTLRGLDRALPKDIVFTCLSPNQGASPQPDVLAEISKNRQVWAIPWLEGDRQLWHLQPRVSLLRDQVRLADKQDLDGVLAIHWRTEETRANLDAFAQTASAPSKAPSVEEFYQRDCLEQFGPAATERMAELLVKLDVEQSFVTSSPVYYPYDPSWGRLQPQLRSRLEKHLAEIRELETGTGDRSHRANLRWLADNFEFTLLLDEVGRAMEPAYKLKERCLREDLSLRDLQKDRLAAQAALEKAPIENLFRIYARRVRSKGELGELSSLNQRVWLQYRELDAFLRSSQE